jgi:hypothetical protein
MPSSISSSISCLLFLHCFSCPIPLTTSDLYAIWESVILDTQYAIHLNAYIECTNDYVLKELVHILRAADLLTAPAAELQ